MPSELRRAFTKWLKETFDEDFDNHNMDHLTKFAIFEAGWDSFALRASERGEK